MLVAAALGLPAAPAAARAAVDPFSPHVWPDPAELSGDPVDVSAVSFGQRETQLELAVHTQGDMSAARLPDSGVCLTLVRVGRVCVGGHGGGRAVARYGQGARRALRPIPGAIVRGGHRSIVVRFHPRAIGLPFGRVRWLVESHWQSHVDRVPDQGYGAARMGALGEPRCFGAAARAGRRPCRNRALGRMVIPRPSAAYVMADTPCRPIQRPRHAVLEPCEFGDLDRRRPPSVALIGDSHAGHFRAAVEVVAQARGWRAVAMTHPGCAFSTEVDDAPDGKGRCHRHSQEAVRWLRAHPTVHTVFTSSSGGEGSTPGGFLAMWARVPASVHRIHVIRDVPRARLSTAACVSSVIRRHARPWRACTVPRSSAVIPDTTAQAAARAPARVDLIDLTRYFCNASRCFPVIGGVYAYRDETHINRVFSTTLGPYLLRAIGASRVD